MNKLKEEFMHRYEGTNTVQNSISNFMANDIFNWINQNYISKQQILNLECLKEEEFDESDDVIDEEVREKRNQLRKEIIYEINNLLKKHETIQNKK